jgi:Bacterial Ig domain
MKRALWIALLISLGVTSRLQAQIVSFNLSDNPATVSGWVNVAGDPSYDVLTVTDPTSHITITTVSTSNWVQWDSSCANDGCGDWPGTYFPSQVWSNVWDNGTGNPDGLANYNALVPQFVISGLNPDSTYILRMGGSNFFYSGNQSNTQYTLAGAVVYPSQVLSTYDDESVGITFQGISPDATGKIKVYVNTASSASIAFICGLQIFPGSANVGTPIVTLTAPKNGTILPEGGNFNLSATASETGNTIQKVVFYADTTEIGEVDNPPYNLTWTDPDPGSYTIRAVATDQVGTIGTAQANVAVESLNYFWSTTGNIATGADSNFVGTVDSNALAFRTKDIERMRISAIGNVGIGTDSPTAQLHTTGTVRLAGLTNDSTKTRVLVTDSSGNMFYRNASSLTGRWLYASGTGTVYDSIDNVAIGTSNPQGYKLAVNGTAIFTKVKVKTAGTWPDYVFNNGYVLPDLPALEKYIKANKHLPGILSAKEAGEKGIDVGENQAALLKKIEEMTLLLIDQNKRLTEQQTRLDAQQKEIDDLKAMIKTKK